MYIISEGNSFMVYIYIYIYMMFKDWMNYDYTR